MGKLLFITGIIFMVLTFLGVGYVFLSNGKVSAGLAVIPMLFALISINAYRKIKKDYD